MSLRATRSGPRLEFLRATAFFGTSDSLVSTNTYFDTLASFNILSVAIFDKLRTRDTNGDTRQYTTEYFDFECAVRENTHQAEIVRARIQLHTFVAWNPFEFTHLNSFDCILGYDFCATHLVGIRDFRNRQLPLRDQHGQLHTVIGDGDFIAKTKLDLVVPPGEVLKVIQTPRCLYLTIQPLDPSKELQAEVEDFALKRSRLSG
eukprot:scaffold753_cov390-Pavlova_lutheri.AAC.13